MRHLTPEQWARQVEIERLRLHVREARAVELQAQHAAMQAEIIRQLVLDARRAL